METQQKVFIMIIAIVLILAGTATLANYSKGKITDWNDYPLDAMKCLVDCEVNIKLAPPLAGTFGMESPIYNITLDNPNASYQILDWNHNPILLSNLTVKNNPIYFILKIHKPLDQNVKWTLHGERHYIDPPLIGVTADDFMPNLVSVYSDLTYGTLIYEFKNTFNDTTFPIEKIGSYMATDGKTPTDSVSYYIGRNATKIENTYNNKFINRTCNSSIFNNQSLKYETVAVDCSYTDYVINGTTSSIYIDWQPITTQTVNPKETVLIKMVATFKPTLGNNNRDIVPTITVPKSVSGDTKDYTFSQTKWAWWNTSWSYKRNITVNISNSTNNLQLPINITWSINMNSDFSDLRFVNASENAQYDYYIESQVNSSWAYVWVEGNFTNSNGTQIVMYYGNPTATSQSNGTNTFLLFEEFNGAALDTSLWETIGAGTTSVGNGVLNISSTTENWYGIQSKLNFTRPILVKWYEDYAYMLLNGYNTVVWMKENGSSFGGATNYVSFDWYGSVTHIARNGIADPYSRTSVTGVFDNKKAITIYANQTLFTLKEYNITSGADVIRVSNITLTTASPAFTTTQNVKDSMAIWGRAVATQMSINKTFVANWAGYPEPTYSVGNEITTGAIKSWQYADVLSYTNLTITWSLTVYVYNNLTAAVNNIIVTPDSNFSSSYTIASLAAGAVNYTTSTKQYTRANVSNGGTDVTLSINATTLSGDTSGTSNTLTLINPVDPPDKQAELDYCNIPRHNGVLYCDSCSNITTDQNLANQVFNITRSGVVSIYSKIYNYSYILKNSSCLVDIYPGSGGCLGCH